MVKYIKWMIWIVVKKLKREREDNSKRWLFKYIVGFFKFDRLFDIFFGMKGILFRFTN